MNTPDKIRSFGELERGWHFGSGIPAPAPVIDQALKIERLGYIFNLQTSAFPSEDGGICVTFYNQPHFFDVTINPSLKLDWYWEDGVGLNYSVVGSNDNVPLVVIVHNLFLMSLK